MKKLLTVLMVALMIGSIPIVDAIAQAQQGQQGQLQNAFRISELMDKKVQTQQGQELGNIEDVVVDRQGQNAYLILSGDKLGKENQLIPIPVKAASPQMQRDAIVISLSQQQLMNAPGFQEGNWAQFSQIQQRVNTYYQQPGAQQGQQQQQPKQQGTR